jgi:hypothetical protein
MRGNVARQMGVVALLVATATGVPFFVSSADAAQRPFTPANGTDCLVVTGTAPTSAPRVLGSRQVLQEAFAEGDELFIGGPGVGALSVGERLQFVCGYGQIRHPGTNEVISDAIGWLGFADVVAVDAERAIVRVTKSCREIEVGEYLLTPDPRDLAEPSEIPHFEPDRLITPDPADPVVILGELESVVSDSGESRIGTAARDTYAQRDVVIIDQGSTSGWAPGDLVDMYRPELALKTRTSATVYTPMPLALGMVVAVGEDAAAVLIVESEMAIQLGDRVARMGSAGRN